MPWETISTEPVPGDKWETVSGAVAPTAAPTAPRRGIGGFLGAAAENLIPEPLRHPSLLAQIPGAFRDVVARQIQTGDPTAIVLPGVTPMVQALVNGIVRSSADAYRQQRAQGTNVVSSALAATPIIGPPAAQAGEEIGQGRYAEGLGHAAGMLAPFAAGPAARLAGGPAKVALAADVPGILKSPEKGYAQVLGATRGIGTKGNQLIAEKVVPGLLERGIMAPTRKSLLGKLEAGASAAGDALDEALANVPSGQKVDLKKAYNRLEGLKDEHLMTDASGAAVPANAQAAQTLESIQALQDSIINGDASFGNVRKLRQILDRQVVAGDKVFGRTLREGSVLDVTREGANALREVLADAAPDVAKANKELTFWLNARKVMADTVARTASHQEPLGQTMAQVAGGVAGAARGASVAGIVGWATGAKILKAAVESTGWRTASAVMKYDLSKALVAGDVEKASQLAGRIIAASPKEQAENDRLRQSLDTYRMK